MYDQKPTGLPTKLLSVFLFSLCCVAGCNSGGGSSSSGNSLNNNNQNDGDDSQRQLVAVVLSADPTHLTLGDSTEISALATYDNGDLEVVTDTADWSSSDTGVVDFIDGTPLFVEATGTGTADVTATFDGVDSDSLEFEVAPAPVTSVTLTLAQSQLEIGGTTDVTVVANYQDGSTADVSQHVTWVVGNESLLSITSGTPAVLTGLLPGTTVVAASLGGVVSGSVTVTVAQPDVTSLAVSASSLSLELGETADLSVLATYASGSTTDVTSQVSWSVGDPSILEVTDGDPATAEALAEGATTLTASFAGETSSPLTLTVLSPALTELTISATTTVLSLGDSADLTVSGSYADGSSEDVTDLVSWSLQNPTVLQLTVGNPTSVLALQTGSSLVTAELDGVSSDPLTVTVPGDVLIPGSGWTGSTSEPSAVGSSSNMWYTERSIANWDVVPYQRITGATFEMGVVAFHGGGISHVSIGVDGNWIDIPTMTYNPRTDVNEYVATLDLTQFAPGYYEFRAIAYPNHGRPRLLESLNLYVDPDDEFTQTVRYVSSSGSDSNSGSESSPLRTVQKAIKEIASANGGNAAGGIVYCQAGNIEFNTSGGWGRANTSQHYVIVKRAPGVAEGSVVITDFGNGTNTKYLKFEGIDFDITKLSGNSIDNIPQPDDGNTDYAWFHDCRWTGGGRGNEPGGTSGPGPILANNSGYKRYYMTDCTISETANGPKYVHLGRNVLVQTLGEDAFRNPRTIINCHSRDQHKPSGSSFHTDVIQIYSTASTFENCIIYNYLAEDSGQIGGTQGFFCRSVTGMQLIDCAVVNFVMDQTTNAQRSKIKAGGRHLLLWNCTFRNQRFEWLPDAEGQTFLKGSVRNSYFDQFSLTTGEAAWDQSVMDNCHIRSTNPSGYDGNGPSSATNLTTGSNESSLFDDVSANDFTPKIGGLLDGSERPSMIASPLVPQDLHGSPWRSNGAIGALEIDE